MPRASQCRSTLFAVAAAERLPCADASVDLLTAAGSLNYADLDAFVGEADRVLRTGGAIAVSNYSFGRPTAPAAAPDWPERFAGAVPTPGVATGDRGVVRRRPVPARWSTSSSRSRCR